MAQAPAKENLLIIGATGYIGKYILEQIVQAKASFGRIAIFTSPSTVESKAQALTKLKERGVEIIVGDVNNLEELSKALDGITTVISAISRTAIASQIAWLPILSSSPTVKRFYPSEYGTDIEHGPSSATEPPHQQKLKVRAALKGVKDLEYTYIVTGPYADADSYMDVASRDRVAGSFDVKAKKAVVIGDGKGRVSMTTPNDVGRLVVASLLHPSESRNRALKVNSFTTTPLEVVAEFEKQTGGEKWEISYTPLEKLKELEKQAWEEKNPRATLYTLRRIWAEGGTLYDEWDNGLIGLEAQLESLGVAVKDAIRAQTET